MYIRLFLGHCEIDKTVFAAHSVRNTSTSKTNLSIKNIKKTTGLRRSSTSQRFYKLPQLKNFGEELLCHFEKS